MIPTWKKVKSTIIPLLFITSVILILVVPKSKQENTQKEADLKKINMQVLFPSGIQYANASTDSTIDADTSLSAGIYQYRNFYLQKGKLTLNPADYGEKIVITATQKIIIDKDASIYLTRSGNKGAFADTKAKGMSPGINYQLAGGGGGNVTRGGDGDCRVKNDAGSISPITSEVVENGGSGGGVSEKNKTDIGGSGGGLLYLIAPEIDIQGEIIADGGNGTGGGGGGSGGTVILYSDNVSIRGTISLKGGAGGTAFVQGGGGGSGGVLIINRPLSTQEYNQILFGGGIYGKALDLYSGCNGTKGSDGAVILLQ
jgi:hypothetical protein